jgi:hypothetical protein
LTTGGVRPRRPHRRYGQDDESEVAMTDAILDALSRRRALPPEPSSTRGAPGAAGDPAVRLLAALVDDVDQSISGALRCR